MKEMSVMKDDARTIKIPLIFLPYIETMHVTNILRANIKIESNEKLEMVRWEILASIFLTMKLNFRMYSQF